MRADRLLAILLLLQRGGRTTAGELARRLEVSERTIYRDLEALGAAGVPVYAEQGRGGGVRLVEGYSTDLSGLSLGEAELVPLLGLSDLFAKVGAGPSLAQTETKLLMALPPDQRRRAEQSRRKLYVDVSRWWDTAEAVPHLGVVIEAVFAGRKLRLRYRRGEDAEVVRRTIDPYGLVIQGGTWYLVAKARADIRTYRVSRIMDAKALDEHHEVPDEFDLATFWTRNKQEFHESRPGFVVRARVESHVRAFDDVVTESGPDVDGWTVMTLTFEWVNKAYERILGLGNHVEVLEPAEFRANVQNALRRTLALYESSGLE